MKYEISILINEKKDRVAELYVDKELMHLWEQGLNRVDSYQGTLYETGSRGALVFMFNQKEMSMKVSVENNNLPESLTVIYEVPGAWNRFVVSFEETQGITLCNIESEFRFDEPNNVPVEAFIEKTTEGMNHFKRFVEGMKR